MGGGGAVIAQLVKASDSDWLPRSMKCSKGTGSSLGSAQLFFHQKK